MNTSSPETEHHAILSSLTRIEEKVNKIEQTLNPPFGKKLLRWIGKNSFTIILLIIVIFLTFKTWDMYQDTLVHIEAVKNMPTNVIDSGKDVLKDVVDKLRF